VLLELGGQQEEYKAAAAAAEFAPLGKLPKNNNEASQSTNYRREGGWFCVSWREISFKLWTEALEPTQT